MSQYLRLTLNPSLCNSLFRLFIAVLIASLTNTAFADTIVLDDFEHKIDPASGVTFSNPAGSNFDISVGEISIPANATASWTETLPGTGHLWNTRSGSLATSLTGSSTAATSSFGFLSVALPNDLQQSLTLSYYGTPDAEKNLTAAGDLFYLDVLASEYNVSGSIKLYDASGQSSTAPFVIQATVVPSSVSVSLATVYATVDRSRITRADLSLSLPNGTDLQIDSIYFAPVPEPSTVVFGLIAAVFTGIKIARKRRASGTAYEPHIGFAGKQITRNSQT